MSTLDTVATVNVINLEFGSGGTVDETDSEYGARAQGFYRSARRGTRFAIEEGARTTPGVTQATATELLSPYDTQPKFRGSILVADANGQANRALTERVRLNLENYRALGVPLSVKGGIPYYPDIVIEGLQFVAGANTIAVIEQVRAVDGGGLPVARKRLQVQADSLRVAKADVEWYPLPPDFEVVGGESEPVRPSPGRQFFVTVETFNPFHGLCEAEPWP